MNMQRAPYTILCQEESQMKEYTTNTAQCKQEHKGKESKSLAGERTKLKSTLTANVR